MLMSALKIHTVKFSLQIMHANVYPFPINNSKVARKIINVRIHMLKLCYKD